MRTTLAIVIVTVLASHALAQAPDPFAVLRDPTQSWTYEVVTGPSLATLKPVAAAPQARCQVTEWKEEGRRGSAITCRAIRVRSDHSTTPDVVAAIHQSRYLIFDQRKVRQLAGPLSKPTYKANAFSFTFPRRLTGKRWTYDQTDPNGDRALIAVRTEMMPVRGTRQRVWISESTQWLPAGGKQRILRGAAVFAPSVGPVLLCKDVEQPETDYWCLRLIADAPGADLAKQIDDVENSGAPPLPPPAPPSPVLRVASAKAHVKSSLKARAVAHKISVGYGAQLKRCYRQLLARKPDARGALNIDITINAVGRVGKPSLRSFDAGLTRCAGKLVGSWRFPIPQSEYAEPRNARFTIVLALTPS